MPQSERLSAHGILEEIESNPVLRKQLMEMIIKELKEESELRSCVVEIVDSRMSHMNSKKR